MSELGRFLILVGLVIAGFGVLLTFGERLGWFGRLPGDVIVRRNHFVFYLPLTSCLILSVLLTLAAWFLTRRR
jgi:hypothetical protein